MSTINLLPEDYIRRGARHRANILCLGLFAVTMVAVVTAALVSEQGTRRTQEVRDQVDASYAHAAMLIRQMQNLDVRKQNMLSKAKSISCLLEKVPRSHLLGVVTNALPDRASLVKVELDSKRVIAAAPTPKNNEAASKFDSRTQAKQSQALPPVVVLDITGMAGTDVDVARFIANLARNPLVATVDLLYSQEKLIDKQPVREFQIHLELKSDADAINDPPESLAGAGEGIPNSAVAKAQGGEK